MGVNVKVLSRWSRRLTFICLTGYISHVLSVAGRKTTNSRTGVYCRFVMKSVQCCPGKLGRKGWERESILGDCLLGQGWPLLCVAAVRPLFLTCSFDNTHKWLWATSSPNWWVQYRSINYRICYSPSSLPSGSWMPLFHGPKFLLIITSPNSASLLVNSRSSRKLAHEYLYQKLSLMYSRNLPGCLRHSVLPFV